MILRMVWIVIGVYVGFCLLLFALQSRLLYYPTREISATPREVGLPYEDVYFQTSDGLTLHGWFVPAENARAVLLFCHGNAGNISDRLDSIRIFHGLRLSTFIFDYRGYGRSEGRPSEEGTGLDAEAAWRHLTETRGVSERGILVFGRSLGGAVAANLAAKHEPRGLIIESAFTSVPDLAAQLYPLLPAILLCCYRYDTEQALRRVRSRTLIVHSVDDDLIPVSHGHRLREAVSFGADWLEIAGSHDSGFLTSGKKYVDGLDAFVSKVLSIERREVVH